MGIPLSSASLTAMEFGPTPGLMTIRSEPFMNLSVCKPTSILALLTTFSSTNKSMDDAVAWSFFNSLMNTVWPCAATNLAAAIPLFPSPIITTFCIFFPLTMVYLNFREAKLKSIRIIAIIQNLTMTFGSFQPHISK